MGMSNLNQILKKIIVLQQQIVDKFNNVNVNYQLPSSVVHLNSDGFIPNQYITKTIVDSTSTSVEIDLSGGKQYIFEQPLTHLTINSVENVPAEDEIIFTCTDSNFIKPSQIVIYYSGEDWGPEQLITISPNYSSDMPEYVDRVWHEKGSVNNADTVLDVFLSAWMIYEDGKYLIKCIGNEIGRIIGDTDWLPEDDPEWQGDIVLSTNTRNFDGIFASSDDAVNWTIEDTEAIAHFFAWDQMNSYLVADSWKIETDGEPQKTTITLPENVKIVNNKSLTIKDGSSYVLNFKNAILCYGEIN